MSENYDPDFVERNGAWLLSVFGVASACLSGLLVYFLKSRCSHIKCCGFECTRDVLDLTVVPESALSLEMSRRNSARVRTPLPIAALRRAVKEPVVVNSEPPV